MINKAKYNCLEELKKPGAPVVIVAVTQEIEAIINSCTENGIKVSGLCDNETRKVNKKIKGIDVIHTGNLPDKFPKARLLVAYHNIQECVDQLTSMGYEEFYSPLEILKDYDASKYQHNLAQDYIQNKVSISVKSHEAYFNENLVHLRSLDIVITTKCSMKCESCANLMQYYTSPQNTDEKILSAVENLYNNVDEISEYRIIGGEPLINKNWYKIVNGTYEKGTNRKIFIYTNGTIPVKDEILKSFQGKNINFYVTDYGKLSRNINSLEESLKRNEINYFRRPAGNWVDCSSIRQHNRSPKDNAIMFKECCAKQFYTLLSGKLYTCPFISNAYELNAIPKNPMDYVDLLKNNENLKDRIRKLVKMEKFFPGCDFCDGRPYDPTTAKIYDGKGLIAAGQQTKSPLPFKKIEN